MDRSKPEPDRVTMDGGMPLWKSLAALAIIGGLTFLPLKVVGAESAYDCGTIPCDAFEADPTDQPSLQREQLFMPVTVWVPLITVFSA